MKIIKMKIIKMKMEGGKEGGFTLIELILSMVILSIIAGAGSYGIIAVTEGFVSARDKAEMLVKAEVATLRLEKELQQVFVTSTTYPINGSAGTLTFGTFRQAGTEVQRTISYTSPNLYYNDGANHFLLNGVTAFNFTYYTDPATSTGAVASSATRIIRFDITITDSNGNAYTITKKVTSRNL
jgi:prepilin-type N-terminal cleavage/methylation domain-containing protein